MTNTAEPIIRQLIAAFLNGEVKALTNREQKEVARIALASLEARPVTVIPEEVPATLRDEIIDLCDGYEIGDVGAQEIWSACRLVMLQGEGDRITEEI